MTDDDFDFDQFDDDPGDLAPLDDHELAQVGQDLEDLDRFEVTFGGDGYVGVSVLCQDCIEEHYYPWDLLRGNLRMLIESGEVPVHEPAFQPDPAQYVPWEYARGYVDALQDAGVHHRVPLTSCPQCRLSFDDVLATANFCPRCGLSLLAGRLQEALAQSDLDDDTVTAILRRVGLPT